MSLIVQKYGGSSLATLDHVRRVSRRILRTRDAGHDAVVVVSAMGKTTSRLLEQARAVSPAPAPRELDMLLSAGERMATALLAMALGDAGAQAISLSGPQAGIRTDTAHFNARITGVDPSRIRAELSRGRIVVVAGYQGSTPAGEIATLGRGGSDTTAVALAAELGASRCEICSDVDGIYTADPRLVETATRIEQMAYEDMLALARHGARVLSTRAVEYARRTETPVHALATFGEGAGTIVHQRKRNVGHAVGIASHSGLVRIDWDSDRKRDSLSWALERLEISEPFHYQSSPGHAAALHHELLVPAEQLGELQACAARLEADFQSGLRISHRLGSVSVIGTALESHEATRRRLARRLAVLDCTHARWLALPDALTCILPDAAVTGAARGLHQEFIEAPRRRAA